MDNYVNQRSNSATNSGCILFTFSYHSLFVAWCLLHPFLWIKKSFHLCRSKRERKTHQMLPSLQPTTYGAQSRLSNNFPDDINKLKNNSITHGWLALTKTFQLHQIEPIIDIRKILFIMSATIMGSSRSSFDLEMPMAPYFTQTTKRVDWVTYSVL